VVGDDVGDVLACFGKPFAEADPFARTDLSPESGADSEVSRRVGGAVSGRAAGSAGIGRLVAGGGVLGPSG
jgi:hypothetical protein